jgi:hypothetical protein
MSGRTRVKAVSGQRPPVDRADAGFAMVSAILLMMLGSGLMLASLVYCMGEVHQTGQLRQRNSALDLAEGQVDTMVQRITQITGSAANLPCTATTTDTSSVPDTVTISTTVAYYDAAGTILTCPLSSTATPARALVRSVATGQTISQTLPTRRVMEALLTLQAPPPPQLTKSIFSGGSMTISNNTTINGTGGTNNADLYTNGAFSCSNNETISGSVYTQSTLSMTNSCVITGDAWAVGGFVASSPQNSVGGRVLVSGGNATLDNHSSAAGGVQASGTITWSRCPAQCSPNTPVPAPPVQTFPQLSWDAATQQAWIDAGYTIVTQNDCSLSGGTNGPGQWLADNAATLTGPTLLRTTCRLSLNGGTARLANDLAVFADGGITLDGNLSITSTTAGSRNLYLVQPYNAALTPCSVDGILVKNHVSVDSTVSTLLYSPCIVHKANLATITGQMYSAATVQIDNQLNMTFASLPVYGVIDPSRNQTWKADILSKRENH